MNVFAIPNPRYSEHRLLHWAMIPIFLSLVLPAFGQYPEGKAVLEAIDRNLSSKNRVFTFSMVIHGRRGSRTIQAKSWAEGDTKAFTEYLAPARERGVKMLKLEDQLWMYAPSTDRTIQISGHMLRQSVMGSDLSYEDMMEDARLADAYDAQVIAVETIDARSCWVVELKGRTQDLAYQTRKLWVDQERFVPLREELFAKSGTLLKRTELKEVQRIDGRWFPMEILFKDVLKTGQGTEFIVESIAFDQDIPQVVFTKASLRR